MSNRKNAHNGREVAKFTVIEDVYLAEHYKEDIEEIARKLNKTTSSVARRIYRLGYTIPTNIPHKSGKQKSDTLCWKGDGCKHATNPEQKCPWTRISRNGKTLEQQPVPGWVAEKITTIENEGGVAYPIKTYNVISCPLYEKCIRGVKK